MHVHSIAPARYLQASHDIIRHPRLTGPARSLLLWALSLPSGHRETLQSIGARMPEGKIAISKARRQLIDEGYVHVRKAQSPTTGMWSTATLVSNVPLRTPEEIGAAWDAVEAPPGDRMLTVGEPGRQGSGRSPKKKTEENTTLPDIPEQAEAAAMLCRLGQAEPRLRLGIGEAAALAPLAAEWVARGATESDLRVALLPGLPYSIKSAAGLLRSRLERKLPPVPIPVVAAEKPPSHECALCRAPVPQAGICAACTGVAPAPRAGGFAEAARRGAAAARAAGWGVAVVA